MYAILLASVRDLTLKERIDSKFQDQGWGSEDAIVRVGDTIMGAFNDDEFREYGLNCILCKQGRNLGSIENACANCKFNLPAVTPQTPQEDVLITTDRYRYRPRGVLYQEVRAIS